MKARLKIEDFIFTSCIGLVMLIAVIVAKEWPLRASIGILVLGGIGVLLAILQVISHLRSGSQEQEPAFETPRAETDSDRGNVEIWGWIAGFYGAILLVGVPVAVPLFVLLYNKTYGGSWPLAISLSVLAWVFVFGIFEKILHVPWPMPLLRALL